MRVIIATHGKLAHGFKSSLELICGPLENVQSFNFYGDDSDDFETLSNYLEKFDSTEKIIFCTDIEYGSVNQQIIKEVLKRNLTNAQILSGVNLPLLLEIVTKLPNTDEILSESLLFQARAALKVVEVDLKVIEESIFLD